MLNIPLFRVYLLKISGFKSASAYLDAGTHLHKMIPINRIVTDELKIKWRRIRFQVNECIHALAYRFIYFFLTNGIRIKMNLFEM